MVVITSLFQYFTTVCIDGVGFIVMVTFDCEPALKVNTKFIERRYKPLTAGQESEWMLTPRMSQDPRDRM